MCLYDVHSQEDLKEAEKILASSGCKRKTIDEALDILSGVNTGFTFTNYAEGLTVVMISRASSPEQMYDTIQHELKHVTEHISEYYDVESREEAAAYLQGEIARKMYVAASMLVCPRCNC